jgi:hypothetical protein
VLWSRNDLFRFRLWKSFGSGSESSFASNNKNFLQINLTFTVSDAALFFLKLALSLDIFTFLLPVHFMLDLDPNSVPEPDPEP